MVMMGSVEWNEAAAAGAVSGQALFGFDTLSVSTGPALTVTGLLTEALTTMLHAWVAVAFVPLSTIWRVKFRVVTIVGVPLTRPVELSVNGARDPAVRFQE